jgi:adenylosuccinate lyase
LANLKEVEEPFSKTQIGSSAMAYKRNPMRSERVCSLARYVIGLPSAAAHTHANQWFERTLDDSAIRRMILPEGFLATDVILNLLENIGDGLHVWPEVVKMHVMAELPFMSTEVILMECKCDVLLVLYCMCVCIFESNLLFGDILHTIRSGVKAGGDRQELHEAIRVYSMEAGAVVKGEGKPNDLLERIQKDDLFKAVHDKLDTLIDPMAFVGRAPQQVDDFILDEIDPILTTYADLLKVVSVDGVDV